MSLLCGYHSKRGYRVKGGLKTGWRQDYSTDNSNTSGHLTPHSKNHPTLERTGKESAVLQKEPNNRVYCTHQESKVPASEYGVSPWSEVMLYYHKHNHLNRILSERKMNLLMAGWVTRSTQFFSRADRVQTECLVFNTYCMFKWFCLNLGGACLNNSDWTLKPSSQSLPLSAPGSRHTLTKVWWMIEGWGLEVLVPKEAKNL
jgi:hypothetical protein